MKPSEAVKRAHIWILRIVLCGLLVLVNEHCSCEENVYKLHPKLLRNGNADMDTTEIAVKLQHVDHRNYSTSILNVSARQTGVLILPRGKNVQPSFWFQLQSVVMG
jgi:hypothetical protein